MTAVSALQATSSVAANDLLALCKSAADGLRLDILRVLQDESFGVLELCHIFQMSQPGMSHHLKVLASGGLVETRREGNSIFYRRPMIDSGSPLIHLMDSFFETVDRIPLAPEVVARTAEVHTERARSSRQFFEKHADQFKDNQSLIADFTHYAACVRDLISNEQIGPAAKVLEVGPGESELLAMLASKFDQVTALDNSREMLAKAQGALTRELKARVSFVHGEAEDLAASGATLDLIVMNMVLHHLPSPARLFRTASQLLNPAGRLLIIDLRPHNQDWARDICGDLWLGFEPSDLEDWAAEAGLERGQSVYLGLKNGFQIQVRLFHKPQT